MSKNLTTLVEMKTFGRPEAHHLGPKTPEGPECLRDGGGGPPPSPKASGGLSKREGGGGSGGGGTPPSPYGISNVDPCPWSGRGIL